MLSDQARVRATLDGKVAVVTGAANGIGLAAALRLASDQADIAMLDLDSAALASSADAVRAQRPACTADLRSTARTLAASLPRSCASARSWAPSTYCSTTSGKARASA